MGRTIHYQIRGPRELTGAEGYNIGTACQLMNERFSWSGENLALDFDFDSHFRLSDDAERDFRAWGFTKVRADEWNAFLVVRFLLWASAALPEHTVEIFDEGGYILVSTVRVTRGVPEANLSRLQDTRDAYEQSSCSTSWIDNAIAASERGELFATLPAREYRDVPELANLDVCPEELGGSVDALAKRLLQPLGLWTPVDD